MRAILCLFAGWGLIASSLVYGQGNNPADTAAEAPHILSLHQAVDRALTDDVWQQASQRRQAALDAQSIAAGQLPDPVISLGVANLPSDSFSFDQEAMTQVKLGVTQSFPRGDTLALKQQQQKQLADAQPWQRELRAAQVMLTVRQQWLQAYQAQQSIALIEQRRGVFEQLLDVTRSRYRSAVGKTQQQDVVRAEVLLTRLDDRVTHLYQQYDNARQQLGQWLPPAWTQYSLAEKLPDISLTRDIAVDNWQLLGPALAAHPQVKAFDQQIVASETEVELAKQQYKPAWGVNASYGWRGDDDNGRNRADMLSVGVSVSVPLFPANRQDQTLSAARNNAEAKQTDRILLIRELRSRYQQARQQLSRINQRYRLYQQQLLTQFHQQSQATLNAYTADVGDFTSVMQAYIAELDAQLEALQLATEQQQTRAQLDFLLAGVAAPGGH